MAIPGQNEYSVIVYVPSDAASTAVLSALNPAVSSPDR
jgi:hypothetical protein